MEDTVNWNNLRKIASLNADGVLAIIFLIFCIYVGWAGTPQFMIHSGYALENDLTLEEYIGSIDGQYEQMLQTEKKLPILHNKATYVNFNGLMARIMDQPELNELIMLKNGYLSWTGGSFSHEELDTVFVNIQKLAERQKSQGKEFLFVLAPGKTYQFEEYAPAGYSDTLNEDADYFLGLMEQNDIAYLDLRRSMEQDGISYEDAFYKTDHHWTTQTGFWAYTKIVDALHQMGTITEVDSLYTDPENYNFEIYENSFLGSLGKRTGRYFSGVDDFCVITPKYPTNISAHIPSAGIDVTGEFAEAAYNNRSMDILDAGDYFNDNPYGLYGWSDRPLISWRNENAPEDQRVMLIGNSYGNVPFAFMSLYFTSCEELDMRSFAENFEVFYNDYAPDTVVLLVHVENVISENTTYPFFAE